MGNRRFVYFKDGTKEERLWVVVYIGFEFRYLTPLIFLSTPFISLVSSLLVKGAKKLQEEGRKEIKIPPNFQLYFLVSYGCSIPKNVFLDY